MPQRSDDSLMASSSAFQLRQLFVILLSGIRVTMVHKLTDLSLGTFNGLTGLSSLHLVSNKLAKIRPDTFKNLHNLNNLPLAGNSFSIKEEVNKTSVTIDVSIDPNGTYTIVLLTPPQ